MSVLSPVQLGSPAGSTIADLIKSAIGSFIGTRPDEWPVLGRIGQPDPVLKTKKKSSPNFNSHP